MIFKDNKLNFLAKYLFDRHEIPQKQHSKTTYICIHAVFRISMGLLQTEDFKYGVVIKIRFVYVTIVEIAVTDLYEGGQMPERSS